MSTSRGIWTPRAVAKRLLAVGILTMVLSGAVAATAFAGALKVSVGGGRFPSRTLVVSVPGVTPLTAKRVHVTENGVPVGRLSVTSLRRAGQGDFGVMLLIDTDPTMRGAPLNQAIAAARGLAAQRTGNQQLGIMFGGQTTLPLTSDPAAINRALANPPRHLAYTSLLRDATSAVNQLKAANIAAGAVIYVTDDVDRDPAYTPQSVGAYATAAHVRIFVVGIHDAAFYRQLPNDLPPSSMKTLAQAGGGSYFDAVPSQLSKVFTAIEAGLRSKYLIRYRSAQPPGHKVAITVTVDGIPAPVSTSYSTPAPPPPPAVQRPAQVHHHQPFWSTALAAIVAAIGAAIMLGLAVWLLTRHFARSGALRSRVGDFVPTPASEQTVLPPIGFEVADEQPAAFARTSWWIKFVEDVDIGRIGMSPMALIQLTALGSVALAVVLTLVIGTVLVAIPILLIGPVALRTYVNFNVRRQRALFSTQLPPHLEEVAGAMRSGRSLVEALAVVSDGADEPTRSEFDRALADERLGQPLDETIRPIGERMQSPDVEQLAVIAALHRGSGANVAEVLDHVADGARQRDELRRELRVMTAQARLTRWILTALPLAMLLLLTVLRPDYERPLFHTTSGEIFLGVAVGLVALGSYVMSRIVAIEV